MRRGAPGAPAPHRCASAGQQRLAVRIEATTAHRRDFILPSGRAIRDGLVPLSIGNPDPSEDTKTRAVEAGRFWITLVEQVVDAHRTRSCIG